MYLTGSAQTWYYTYVAPLERAGTLSTLTWNNLKRDFLAAFIERTSSEKSEEALRLRRKLETETYEDYFYADLCTAPGAQPMSNERRIKSILRGLHKDTARQVWSRDPQSPNDVLRILRDMERFESIYGRKSATVMPLAEIDEHEQDESEPKLEKTVRHLHSCVDKLSKHIEIMDVNVIKADSQYSKIQNEKPNKYHSNGQFGNNQQQQKRYSPGWTVDGKKVCWFCKKPGHIRSECRSLKRQQGQQGNQQNNNNQARNNDNQQARKSGNA